MLYKPGLLEAIFHFVWKKVRVPMDMKDSRGRTALAAVRGRVRA